MAKSKSQQDGGTAVLEFEDRLAAATRPIVQDEGLCAEIVDRMHEQGRTSLTSMESELFRRSGWLEQGRNGKVRWKHELALKPKRDEIIARLGTSAERQREVKLLESAKQAREVDGAPLEAEIQKLQAKLDGLDGAVSRCAATVQRRERAIEQSRNEHLIPWAILKDASQRRAVAKQQAGRQDWWSWQGRVTALEHILQHDPSSQTDCIKILEFLKKESPECIRSLATNEFWHAKVIALFKALHEELAHKKPEVEAGRAELDATLAEIQADGDNYFLRLAESK